MYVCVKESLCNGVWRDISAGKHCRWHQAESMKIAAGWHNRRSLMAASELGEWQDDTMSNNLSNDGMSRGSAWIHCHGRTWASGPPLTRSSFVRASRVVHHSEVGIVPQFLRWSCFLWTMIEKSKKICSRKIQHVEIWLGWFTLVQPTSCSTDPDDVLGFQGCLSCQSPASHFVISHAWYNHTMYFPELPANKDVHQWFHMIPLSITPVPSTKASVLKTWEKWVVPNHAYGYATLIIFLQLVEVVLYQTRSCPQKVLPIILALH